MANFYASYPVEGFGSGPLTFADSIVNNANVVTLVNDSATPGTLQYYGTNSGGTLGYFPLSTAVLTIGAFGSSPNANGGTISAGVLTLQPADATHPGGVSTTPQTFAGAKTFALTITAPNLTFPFDSGPTARAISVANQMTSNTDGNELDIFAAQGNGSGNGGAIFIEAGDSGASGSGGSLNLFAGGTNAENGTAGAVFISGGGNGVPTDSNGGSIHFDGGQGTGTGIGGNIFLRGGSTNAATITGSVIVTTSVSPTGQLPTSATDGFLYIPSTAGTPTGVATAQSDAVPMVYDTTNNKFYFYNSGWKNVVSNSGITSLTGDVTGTGPGATATTVAKIAGVAVGTPTGTTNVVFSNSPTLVSPALGTPSALVGTNITGTAASFTAGTATNAVNVATTATSTNSSFYPLFVSSSSNSNQAAQLNAGFQFNPSSNLLTINGVFESLAVVLGSNTVSNGQLLLSNNNISAQNTIVQALSTVGSSYNFNLPATAGSSGQFLTSAGGVSSSMTWTSQSSIIAGTANALSVLTTKGDLLYETSVPANARLAIGSTGDVLTVSGGLPVWAAPATAGTVTSVALSVPASSLFSVSGSPVTASGTLGLLTAGTSGGIPYFSSTTQLNASALLTANQMIVGGGAGAAPATLAAGSQFQVLVMGATAPGYGQVNLAQSAAVTGVLPNANTTAASANTASAIVARDGSGNFTAGTITATSFQTASSNPSTSGVFTLSTGDVIGWRNNANSGNNLLGHDTSNELTYGGNAFLSSTGGVLAAAMPALTGDVTTSAGAVATTVAKIQGVTVSGTTGTTNVMFSASPTTTGTLTAAAITASGALIVGGNTTGDSNLGTISSVSNSKYYVGSFSLTFSGPWTLNITVTVTYALIGTLVTLQIPSIIGTSVSGSVSTIVSTAGIPSGLRPTSAAAGAMNQITVSRDNSANPLNPGSVAIATSGIITFVKDLVGNNWTNGNQAGVYGCTFSFFNA